jgi:demethylmacrocin O-methyltransferase
MEDVCTKEGGGFDVVIDDGSHMAEHMRRTFDIMFPHVNDNGWYIIEDTQCSYWPRLGGGYKKDGMIELCKELADCVTWWAIEGQDAARQSPAVAKYNGLIRAVHFHPASVFIEKGPERDHNEHYAFSDQAQHAAWVKSHPGVYHV